MSHKRFPQPPIPNEFTFDPRFLRHGKNIALVHLPPIYHKDIGSIIVYWGQFEILFDTCLRALIERERQDDQIRHTYGWEKFSFKRRKELFKEIVKDVIHSKKPKSAKALLEIIDKSSDLRSKRNLIAHGHFGYTMLAQSEDVVDCFAIDTRTGNKMPFDRYVLIKLYHDIAHLTADLMTVVREIGHLDVPIWTLPDTQILQAVRNHNHLNPAI